MSYVQREDRHQAALLPAAIEEADGATLSKMVTEIDKTRQHGNLSSAIRLFVLDRVRGTVSAACRRQPEAWRLSWQKMRRPSPHGEIPYQNGSSDD